MINIRHLLSVLLIALVMAPNARTEAVEVTTARRISPEGAADAKNRQSPAYAISVRSVLGQRQRIFLVDIRHPDSFDKIRIPGAINLPLDAIKAKAFLKTRPVVLIHEGYGYRRMTQACKRLEGLGFNIRILSGGLNAWQARGGSFEGDPFARHRLNRMPPQAFYLEKDTDNWVLIDAGAVQDATSRTLIPSAIHIPILKDPKEGSKKLENTSRKQRRHPFLSILIFNETGTEYDRIEKMIPKKDLYTLFFLSDGFERYQRFLQNLSLSRKPKESRIKTVSKCKPCIQKKGQPDDK